MPTTTTSTSTVATSGVSSAAAALLTRLTSEDNDTRLKALRNLKNQIIGNRTKKLSYIKLGAVPIIASILSDAVSNSDVSSTCVTRNLLIQSAAALGSFACGVDEGVQAVIDAGAFISLMKLLPDSDAKVVDAGARSLKMIYQSNAAPKYDVLQSKNMDFLISSLDNENSNVSGLAASIITHSCKTGAEQKALCNAGALKKLIKLLDGSINQRDASLESIGAVIKNNPEIVAKFMDFEGGRAHNFVIELTKDKYPRTRLLACICLIDLRNTASCFLQELGIKIKLVLVLLELFDDPGQVGDEAPFAFSRLISEKEDLQKIAFENNAIDKLHKQLQTDPLSPKRYQGLLVALGHLCSKLEECRSRFLALKVFGVVTDALSNENSDVRAAACICLKNVFRSLKNLSAGQFMKESIIIPLLQLLRDPCSFVQVAALTAVSNVVLDFSMHKSVFIQHGGLKQLVDLSKSMDLTIRRSSLWALRNYIFLEDKRTKDGVLLELTPSSLATLVCDPEPLVQEQALGLVRNLVDGCINSVDYAFLEDGIILDAVARQMERASNVEIGIQGMYVLANVASGNEYHKEAVMHQLLPEGKTKGERFINKFLQSDNTQLRTAALWVLVNLTFPSSPGASVRVIKLRNAEIVNKLRCMVNDTCPDAKLRVRTALGQCMIFGDTST